jgi:hypothetical protein
MCYQDPGQELYLPKGYFNKEIVMLVTFKCDVYPDITMLDNVAFPLLKMMGQSGSVPGAIVAQDVPVALARLQNAFKKEKNATEQPITNSPNEEEDEDVSLKTRAFPLIELLSSAAKEKCNVLWDKGTKVPF